MKLPMVEAVRTVVQGRAPNPYPSVLHVKMDVSDEVPYAPDESLLDYRSSAEVFFQQIAPAGAEKMVREKATIAMTRFVYGPVEMEVRRALEALWAEGLHCSEGAKILEAMLPVLRGEEGGE